MRIRSESGQKFKYLTSLRDQFGAVSHTDLLLGQRLAKSYQQQFDL